MIKDILDGAKEVMMELGTGMKESCDEIWVKANAIFTDINVKLMGSYEEIEAFDNKKEASQKRVK